MANNYCGHGFYQFSPELFFRVLSDRNGFAVERMIAFENDLDVGIMFGHTYLAEIAGPWFDVADPEVIGDRVLLLNRRPVLLMIRAARVRDTRVLAAFPQQSDYAAAWTANGPEPVAPARPQPPRRWIDRVVGRSAILHQVPYGGRGHAMARTPSHFAHLPAPAVSQSALVQAGGRSGWTRAAGPWRPKQPSVPAQGAKSEVIGDK